MNWDAIGAGAELLGAFATVATLGYLALQIRQSTKISQVATATTRADQRFRQAALISQSSEINRLFWTGLNDPESLTGDEYRHFESVFSTYLFAFEHGFNFNQQGVLSEAEWEGQRSAIDWLLTTPGFTRYWSTWRDQYPTDFRAFIDSLIAASESPAVTSVPSGSGRVRVAAQQSAAADSAQAE